MTNKKTREQYKDMVICDHADTCGNQECHHGQPHPFENVAGCHCINCYRVKDATPKCRPFLEVTAERMAAGEGK